MNKGEGCTIRLRWLTRGSEYQVVEGRRVIARCDTLEEAKKRFPAARVGRALEDAR